VVLRHCFILYSRQNKNLKMKKIIIRKAKTILLSTCVLFSFLHSKAQKEDIKISEDIIKKVAEITKPVKEQIDKLLEEDATGTYKAYLEEVANLNNLKNSSDKNESIAKINEQYFGFFSGIWASANIDEKGYQQKIKDAFSNGWGMNVEFMSFLNFAFISSSAKKNVPPPPQPPLPENKCIDVCLIAAGEINGSPGLISGGGGSYGNCFLKSHRWSAVAGKNELFGYFRNNISIPGTLPNDSRTLRVKKTFDVNQQATSFALFGLGYAETWVRTFMSYEYMLVVSPVIFMANKNITKTIQEEYLIPKTSIGQSLFKTYAGTFSLNVSANWCFTDCNNIKWNVCEEGKQ
jgi:hypothetical protein